MRYVFDLDGTILDNREAIEVAYRAVGVTVQWHRPWREWCTAAQHAEKNKHYTSALKYCGTFTNLGARLLHAGKPITVLTGASAQALAIVWGLWPALRDLCDKDWHCAMTPEMKADWLAQHGWGTYVDDDAEARRIIQEYTTWHVITPDEAVRRLFSPPAPTRG